jgi:sulfite reductase (ferredoxin)
MRAKNEHSSRSLTIGKNVKMLGKTLWKISMPDAKAWRSKLKDRLVQQISNNIHGFESQMELKKQGKVSDPLFAESRLRLGLYGQRYDNGKRFDGENTRRIQYPNPWMKGPETHWDAPGMVRIKTPKGEVSPEQVELFADLSEEYSDGVNHITTRQDIQLHYLPLADAPSLLLRLAAVGITTQEACGNSVRNITTSPESGVESDELFDVDPYATAMFRFLLGHPDTMEFGRKMKISFSGKEENASGLTNMNDVGFLAKEKTINGKKVIGFRMMVGGGLGAVPHEAVELYDFIPVERMLPAIQAVCRVFSRLGEKKNRALARIKFLVAKLGIEEFKRLVEAEYAVMPHDDRWIKLVTDLEQTKENPKHNAASVATSKAEGYSNWLENNVAEQKQRGYFLVTVQVPLGDLTAHQMRAIADLGRKVTSDSIRLTVDQNIMFRWVSGAELPNIYAALKSIGLSKGKPGKIMDMTACPGTDTCKLGTSSSRGLSWALQQHLAKKGELAPEIENLKIKMSGCYNSCGQHYLADIGFYGVARKKEGRDVPHFQVVLGGRWSQLEGSYGLPIAAIPSKAAPALVDKLTEVYSQERQSSETFHDFIKRIGKKAAREYVQPFMEIPSYETHPEYYTDWGDPRPYSTGDKGMGECAGEIVSLFDFDTGLAEREYFDGQVALDDKDYALAIKLGRQALFTAARALVKVQFKDVRPDETTVLAEFKKRYGSTGLVADKFARYLYDAVEKPRSVSLESGRQILQEAHLLIEEVLACRDKAAAANEAPAKV